MTKETYLMADFSLRRFIMNFQFFQVFVLLLCLSNLWPNDSNDTVDIMHEKVSTLIYETSKSIDSFFGNDYNDIKIKNRSYLQTSLDSYIESGKSFQYRFNIKYRIHLPKTQKRLNLVLEDFKDTISKDQSNSEKILDSANNNNYILGLQFQQLNTKYTSINYGAGVKFGSLSPDPYLTLKLKKDFYFPSKWEWILYEKIRLYMDAGVDNTAGITPIRVINPYLKLSFPNIYRYIEDLNNRNEIVNSIILDQHINNNNGLSYILSLYSSGDSNSPFKLHYYYAGLSFIHYFYKNWIFYRIEPGAIFRETNDFSAHGRVMFQLGLKFGKFDIFKREQFQ